MTIVSVTDHCSKALGPPGRSGGSVDPAGALLLASGPVAVLGSVSMAPDVGWANPVC